MSHFTLSIESTNQKTGEIPVSTSSAITCPSTCPFKENGCYAREGPMRFHWQKVTDGERGMPWSEFCIAVAKLPDGQFWRHNQAGDLPGFGDEIDQRMIIELVEANSGKRGFSYTHKTTGRNNLDSISFANRHGFTVNLSADNIYHADELAKYGPVNVVLPSWEIRKELITPGGKPVKLCPAILDDRITCLDCRWCQNAERNFIVGVPAHGSGVVKVDNIVEKHRLRKLF